MKTFKECVVLISGASSGIGEAAAVAFQAAGAVVYGLASKATTLKAARERHSGIRWLVADVTRPSETELAVKTVLEQAGRLDVLVNNAGIYKFASLESMSDEHVRSLFEVNVFGLISLTRSALPALKVSRGTIVNVSSTAAQKPMSDVPVSTYAATKGAVESLTRAWALELAPSGVRVNAVSPGPTETAGIARLGMPEGMIAQVAKTIPLGRIANSDEVAHWIVALADPSVTWLTGQVLGVDGGVSVS
jgi:NAD(P)-dependent dehydrogenase (short-subunit alcohol dehydrogenase family)